MTKALQLCRSFHAAGHRVVLVESPKYRLTGHRFSRAVDGFHTVPDPDDAGLRRGAARRSSSSEDVDVYVPVCSPAASLPDARAKELLVGALRGRCTSTPTCWRGSTTSTSSPVLPRRWACRVPETHRITDPQQVLDFDFAPGRWPYILKSIAYDPVHRLDLTHLPFGPADEMAAFVRVAADLAGATRGSSRSSSRVRSTAPTARSATAAAGLLLLRVLGVPAELRDGRPPRIRDWVETFVGALRADRPGVLRLHRDPGRRGLRDRVQPAHALGDHDALRPPRRGPGLPRRRRRAAGGRADRGQPTDVLALPRGSGGCSPARRGRRGGARSGPARTRSSTGTTRCRS